MVMFTSVQREPRVQQNQQGGRRCVQQDGRSHNVNSADNVNNELANNGIKEVVNEVVKEVVNEVVNKVVNNITIVQHKIWKAMYCVGWMTLTTVLFSQIHVLVQL